MGTSCGYSQKGLKYLKGGYFIMPFGDVMGEQKRHIIKDV